MPEQESEALAFEDITSDDVMDEGDGYQSRKPASAMKKRIIALGVLVLGIVLLLFPLMFMGGADVQTIAPAKLSPDTNGQLVYIKGIAQSGNPIEDKFFGKFDGALAVSRIVEIYEWQEVQPGEYQKIWSEDLIDSSKFKDAANHTNPTEKLPDSQTMEAEKFSVGVYDLSAQLARQLPVKGKNGWQDLPYTPEQYQALPDAGRNAYKLRDGALYYGMDADNPRIGDMRVRFEKRPPVTVSVLAMQSGNQLTAYRDGDMIIAKLRVGGADKDAMVEDAGVSGGGIMRWLLALVGFVLTLAGALMILPRRGLRRAAANSDDDFGMVDEGHDDHGIDLGEDAIPAHVAEAAGVAATAMSDHTEHHDDEFDIASPPDTPGMEQDEDGHAAMEPEPAAAMEMPTPHELTSEQGAMPQEAVSEEAVSPFSADDAGHDDHDFGIDFHPQGEEQAHEAQPHEEERQAEVPDFAAASDEVAAQETPQKHEAEVDFAAPAEAVVEEPAPAEEFGIAYEPQGSHPFEEAEAPADEGGESAIIPDVQFGAQEQHVADDFSAPSGENEEDSGSEMMLLDDKPEGGDSMPMEVHEDGSTVAVEDGGTVEAASDDTGSEDALPQEVEPEEVEEPVEAPVEAETADDTESGGIEFLSETNQQETMPELMHEPEHGEAEMTAPEETQLPVEEAAPILEMETPADDAAPAEASGGENDFSFDMGEHAAEAGGEAPIEAVAETETTDEESDFSFPQEDQDILSQAEPEPTFAEHDDLAQEPQEDNNGGEGDFSFETAEPDEGGFAQAEQPVEQVSAPVTHETDQFATLEGVEPFDENHIPHTPAESESHSAAPVETGANDFSFDMDESAHADMSVPAEEEPQMSDFSEVSSEEPFVQADETDDNGAFVAPEAQDEVPASENSDESGFSFEEEKPAEDDAENKRDQAPETQEF